LENQSCRDNATSPRYSFMSMCLSYVTSSDLEIKCRVFGRVG
jgi:hypothetical protein